MYRHVSGRNSDTETQDSLVHAGLLVLEKNRGPRTTEKCRIRGYELEVNQKVIKLISWYKSLRMVYDL